jgi:hypothetical protein
MYCRALPCLVLLRKAFLGRRAMADGTVCDGGSRGSTPANGKSEREGEGHGDAGGAKCKVADRTPKAFYVDVVGYRRFPGILSGWDAYGALHFHAFTYFNKERTRELGERCGHVGEEGLIYYRCTRCKRRNLGVTEICMMGVCDGCHYRLCAC